MSFSKHFSIMMDNVMRSKKGGKENKFLGKDNRGGKKIQLPLQ